MKVWTGLATRVFHGIMLPQPQRFALAMLEASQGVATEMEILMQDHSSLPLFSLQPETKEIPLSQGKVAIVDAADFEWLSQWKWCVHRATSGAYYARRASKKLPNGKQQSVYMHRAILEISDPNIQVDHRDGNGLNNTRANLRSATPAQNKRNVSKRSNNTSGYKGVYWRKDMQKWCAMIGVDKEFIWLGHFSSKQEAARAYDSAARRFFGEFAHCNFQGEES